MWLWRRGGGATRAGGAAAGATAAGADAPTGLLQLGASIGGVEEEEYGGGGSRLSSCVKSSSRLSSCEKSSSRLGRGALVLLESLSVVSIDESEYRSATSPAPTVRKTRNTEE